MSRSAASSPPGATALELVVVTGEAVTIAALPASGSVTLGRGEECEVRIDNRSVSRRHAILHLGPPLRIQDLGSANGTFVRDTRSPMDTASTQPLRKLSREAFEIAIGERLSLGSVAIAVRRAALDRRAPSSPDVVVRDPEMRALHEQLGRAARSTISVLLLGETGVGKEVLARAVHDRSPRAKGPFLELNCAALPASLLEGELFGHEKNAFTGASAARAGLFEAADGGTIFLDEIGELPLPVQIKLLRVLEDRKVLRLGGRTARTLDVRFVAATNRDLEAEIARGTFRQDLYFRINGTTFVIPPVRARPSEIAPLAEQFLAAASRTLDRREPLRLSAETLSYLERYAWPGNVRELRNVIERAAVLCSGDVISPADLPAHLTGVTGARGRPVPPEPAAPTLTRPSPSLASEDPERPEPEVREARRAPSAELSSGAAAGPSGQASGPASGPASEQRQQIIDALEQCAGNQTRAARLLGISLRTLVNRLATHNLPRPRQHKPR